jgi:photosystem II stability/assembly factor-like uncharacterized protein
MSFRMLHSVVALSLSTLLFFPLSYAEPASAVSQIQPLAVSSLVLDITNAGDRLVAVGERGHVLVFDGKWQQVQTPVSVPLTKVFFLTEQLGWAVGHDATIIHTNDGGMSWQVQMQSPALEKPFFDVMFTNESDGVAVGAYGLFYRTHDAGRSWAAEFHQELLFEEDASYLAELKDTDPEAYQSESASLLPHFNRIVTLKDGRWLMVGELGLVAVSSDTGKHFERTGFDYDGSMFNVIESSQGIFAMGLRGHVFRTNTALDSWVSVAVPVESSINAAIETATGELYLVGNAGIVLHLDKDGVASIVERRQGENLVTIARGSQGQYWLGGTKGVLALTR